MQYEVMCKRDGGTEIKSLSRKRAVQIHCYGCSGYSHRDRKDCDHTECELHPYRNAPRVQGSEATKERTRAIIAFCLGCCGGSLAEKQACPAITCALWPYRSSVLDRTYEIKDTK